jgi:parvulin-like peptidyl-prolyl isomerase
MTTGFVACFNRRTTRRAIPLLTATVTVALALCGCGSDEPVATVGSARIDASEVQHWTTILADTKRSSTYAKVAREDALEFLIRSAWATVEARRLRVKVSPTDVEEKLNLLTFEQTHGAKIQLPARDPVLRQLLLARNTTHPEKERLMRLALLMAKVEEGWLAQAAREVPQGDVAAYYATHRSQFVVPAVSDIEIIGNTDEAAVLRAKREILAGKPFLEVARHASDDSEAPNGLQHLVRGTEEPPFERHIFHAKPHVLTGPIKQELTYIFEVLHAKPDRQQTLAEATPAIRRKLAPERLERLLRPQFEAALSARTICRARYVVRGCRKYGR